MDEEECDYDSDGAGEGRVTSDIQFIIDNALCDPYPLVSRPPPAAAVMGTTPAATGTKMTTEDSSSSSSSGDSDSDVEVSDDDDAQDDCDSDGGDKKVDKNSLLWLTTEEEDVPISTGPPRTKNEADEFTVIDDWSALVIDPMNDGLQKIGEVLYRIDAEFTVVVQASYTNVPLNEGSVLCLQDGTLLGKINEIFGPVTTPFYIVRWNSAILAKSNVDFNKFIKDIEIYCATKHSVYVTPATLMQKGSDASNMFDEEPAAEEQEFSDDEAELLAKQAKNRQKKGKSTATSTDSSKTKNGVRHNNQQQPPVQQQQMLLQQQQQQILYQQQQYLYQQQCLQLQQQQFYAPLSTMQYSSAYLGLTQSTQPLYFQHTNQLQGSVQQPWIGFNSGATTNDDSTIADNITKTFLPK